MPAHPEKKTRGVRKTLLMGIFWRILIIEMILLIGTLLYEAVLETPAISSFLVCTSHPGPGRHHNRFYDAHPSTLSQKENHRTA